MSPQISGQNSSDARIGVSGNQGIHRRRLLQSGWIRNVRGLLRIDPHRRSLDYLYEYDEMKVVLEGEFVLENLDTGQVSVAKAKDAIFFPKGSRIRFTTPDRALAYYVGHRSFAP